MGKVQKWEWILITIVIFFALAGYSNSIAKTEDEENNISIYREVGAGVVNITSVVVERDFFFNPIPREGAGSGSIIDTDGHILTNHHVIRDSTKLEVTLCLARYGAHDLPHTCAW